MFNKNDDFLTKLFTVIFVALICLIALIIGVFLTNILIRGLSTLMALMF